MSVRYETPGLGSAAVLMALHLPTGLAHSIGELRYAGRHSGRRVALPVSFVRAGDTVVVRVGAAATKTWWRNFRSPHPAAIRIDGSWVTGVGHVVAPASLEHEQVEAVYLRERPRAQPSATDVYVVLEVVPEAAPGPLATLRRRWFTRVTAGEFLGFGAPPSAVRWRRTPPRRPSSPPCCWPVRPKALCWVVSRPVCCERCCLGCGFATGWPPPPRAPSWRGRWASW